jgi:nucleoside-diphosphate-sugar epimerase
MKIRYIGSHFALWLSRMGFDVRLSNSRIENREALIRDLDYHQPEVVICAAGIQLFVQRTTLILNGTDSS